MIRTLNQSYGHASLTKGPLPLAAPLYGAKSSKENAHDIGISIHSADSCGRGTYHGGASGVHFDGKDVPVCSHSPVSVTSFFDAAEQLNTIALGDEYSDEDGFDSAIYSDIDYNEPSKRKIRFKCDETGAIDEDLSEHSFPDYELTPELIEECWFRKKDRKNNKAAVPAVCRQLISPQYRRATMRLASLATQEDCLEQMTNGVGFKTAVETVTHPSARGFEKIMCAQMNLPRKAAKAHSKEIVLLQEMLYDDLDIRTADDIAEEIADIYSMNAENSVNWALILAHGDAVYANEYQRSKST